MSQLLPLVPSLKPFLEAYLPQSPTSTQSPVSRPFVTLTYAASLDSRIAEANGKQTAISHLETKTMTHYLRSRHDALLVGSGTAMADDPGLNCRYVEDVITTGGTPLIRPVVVDKNFQWNITERSRVVATARQGHGLGPFIIVCDGTRVKYPEKVAVVESINGKIIELSIDESGRFSWRDILSALIDEGIKSVMVEGGATIINDLLRRGSAFVDSLIVTIGPVYLGSQGVEVSPPSRVNLKDVTWWSGTRDSIMAARLTKA